MDTIVWGDPYVFFSGAAQGEGEGAPSAPPGTIPAACAPARVT